MEATNLNDVISSSKKNCESSIEAFKRELQHVRTGRASSGLVESLTAEYYGSKTPIKSLGQISTPESRLILIQTYDGAAASAVEKAIQQANLGLNPSREGNAVRVSIPPLTEETRKNLVKALHKNAEDIRVSIRNHRRDANELLKKLEKDGVVTKDDARKGLEKIQKQTDSYIEEIEKLLKAKEAECMEV